MTPTAVAIKPVHEIITEILSRTPEAVSLKQLTKAVQTTCTDLPSGAVRAALIPLITIQKVEFTHDRKFKLIRS
jgi:hypothetical protein